MNWRETMGALDLTDGAYTAQISGQFDKLRWYVNRLPLRVADGVVEAAPGDTRDATTTTAQRACEAAIARHREEWKIDMGDIAVRRERIATTALAGFDLAADDYQAVEACVRRAELLITALDKKP